MNNDFINNIINPIIDEKTLSNYSIFISYSKTFLYIKEGEKTVDEGKTCRRRIIAKILLLMPEFTAFFTLLLFGLANKMGNN